MKTPLLLVNCKCVGTMSVSRVSHIEGQHVTQCSLNQWKNTLTCLRSAVSSVSQQSVPRSADWIRTWTFPPSATPLFSFRSKHMFVRQASGSLRFRLDTEGECWCEHFFFPPFFQTTTPTRVKIFSANKIFRRTCYGLWQLQVETNRYRQWRIGMLGYRSSTKD